MDISNSFTSHEELGEILKKCKFKNVNFSGDQLIVKKILQYLVDSVYSDFFSSLEVILVYIISLSSKLIFSLLENIKIPKLQHLKLGINIKTVANLFTAPLNSVRCLEIFI